MRHLVASFMTAIAWIFFIWGIIYPAQAVIILLFSVGVILASWTLVTIYFTILELMGNKND